MPKRRCSPAEEAANLERRATETNIRLGKKRVTLAMNSCPSCIPHLVSKLESLGYTTERLSQREPVAQSFQALAASRRKVRQEEPATAPKADDDDEHDNKDFAAVPTKYWRLDALSKNLLRDRLVCAIEPVILSPANLRVHLDKEGTTTAREHLLEILEATTGVPRTMPITGDMRDWLKLTQELVSRAQVRGRRALRITFPLNWDTFLFTIVGADESGHCVLVEQNFNGFRVQIPTHKLPDFKNVADLAINRNYSERSAAIYNKKTGDEREYLLVNDFTNHEVDDSLKYTTPKKARTLVAGSGSRGSPLGLAALGAETPVCAKSESGTSSAPPAVPDSVAKTEPQSASPPPTAPAGPTLIQPAPEVMQKIKAPDRECDADDAALLQASAVPGALYDDSSEVPPPP